MPPSGSSGWSRPLSRKPLDNDHVHACQGSNVQIIPRKRTTHSAAFSSDTYSPTRAVPVHPRVAARDVPRGEGAYGGDSVAASADIASDPVKAHRHKSERGKGVRVRVTSYVIGLWPSSAITASILLLTMTGVCRTAH